VSCEAQTPTRSFGSTLLLTVLEGGDAFGVFLAGSPLVRAFLLDAIYRIGKGNSSLDLVQAVVIKDAFPEGASWSITLLGKAS